MVHQVNLGLIAPNSLRRDHFEAQPAATALLVDQFPPLAGRPCLAPRSRPEPISGSCGQGRRPRGSPTR